MDARVIATAYVDAMERGTATVASLQMFVVMIPDGKLKLDIQLRLEIQPRLEVQLRLEIQLRLETQFWKEQTTGTPVERHQPTADVRFVMPKAKW